MCSLSLNGCQEQRKPLCLGRPGRRGVPRPALSAVLLGGSVLKLLRSFFFLGGGAAEEQK